MHRAFLPVSSMLACPICLVITCNFDDRYISISKNPPPRQPSGRVLASSAAGPGFNPKLRTASLIAQWQSAGVECGRSRVQSQVKDRLLDSLVVECWLRVRQVQGSIPCQGQRHTKKVIQMVPGIGNPSKSEVIDRCGENETTE